VDFGADGAVTAINQWVSDTTAGNIPTLLSPDAVGASTKMVLVDAIYFRAKWMTTFDASATTPEAFTKLDGSTVQAPAMSKWILGVRYAEGAGYQALDLPYESGDTSMLVVLPAEGSFPTFEQSFGASEYAALVGSLLPDYVDVTLPKFTIEPPAASIKPELQALGMSAAFTGAADFSGMSGTPLSIGDVIHEAIVKVDESGTVAAAATAVTMDSSVVLQPPTKTFDARRPFLFFIRDVATGTILFSGELVDPS
jgi:serpin B